MEETSKELLEKMSTERCWAITSEFLWRFIVLRGDKIVAPTLGRGDNIIAPVLGAEKWTEINIKIFPEGGKRLYLSTKETLNIPVEDAVDASKLGTVVGKLLMGPEYNWEAVEATPERVVSRSTKCPNWEAYEKFDVDPELRPCDVSHELFVAGGLKAINPKLTYKLTKAIPWGDPYCEDVIEFKDE